MPNGVSDDLTCLIALHSIPGMTHACLRRLINRFGTAGRIVHEATEDNLREIVGLSGEVKRGILACRHRLHWAARIVRRFEALGGRVFLQGGVGYPEALQMLRVMQTETSLR